MYNHKSGIILRKLEKQDALDDLLNLKQESWWGTHKTTIVNSDDQLKWYQSIPVDQLYLIGEWNNSRVGVMGYTDIDMISRCLKLSGSVYEQFRQPEVVKSGAAAGLDFAFEMLNVQRVEAEVLEFHNPAQQLEIDYLGFTVEGRKRKAIYKCGKYYDSIILGMLREEWERHPRVVSYQNNCNSNFNRELMDAMSERFQRRFLATSQS